MHRAAKQVQIDVQGLIVRKYIFGFLFVLCASAAQADTIFGVYAGAGTWEQNFSGDVTSGTTVVNVESDLGVDDDRNNVLYVALEHPLPILPNLRLQRFKMDVEGANTLVRNIEFNGQAFAVSDDVTTMVDLTQTDLLFYYEVLDNTVSLDLGIVVSNMEGELAVEGSTDSAEADFDEFIPMAYGKVRADLPATGLWVAAEAQGISYSGNSLFEFNAMVGYESPFGLGVEAGYRVVDLEIDDFDDIESAELDVKGPYAAINFHF